MLRNKDNFKEAFVTKLQSMFGKSISDASVSDKYVALARVMRDQISMDWVQSNDQYTDKEEKQMYYFSMEFLLGKFLDMYLINMGLKETCQEALAELGINLEEL